jgi:nucleoside-diphosphate-sugar epimerase
VDAERLLRGWGRRNRVSVSILRAPGIYAANRLPIERLKQGTPALRAHDDPYTNHIHADDLARAVIAAMFRAKPNRAYNVNDDAEIKMGAWFDMVADAFQLARPPRVKRDEAQRQMAPMALSFVSESRRLSNARMKRELRVRLRYETPRQLLADVAPRDLKRQLMLPL